MKAQDPVVMDMDIYEIYSSAKENLKITLDRSATEIKDGEYFDMIVELHNPPRQIFPFLKEPSYAYKDLRLKVQETNYTRPLDQGFIEGYKLDSLDPSERAKIRVPLEAKMDLPANAPHEKIMKMTVEAQLKIDGLFAFGKSTPGDQDYFSPP